MSDERKRRVVNEILAELLKIRKISCTVVIVSARFLGELLRPGPTFFQRLCGKCLRVWFFQNELMILNMYYANYDEKNRILVSIFRWKISDFRLKLV